MIRVVADNDWVIFTLLGCGFIYALMFLTLLRDLNLRQFLLLDFEDASNPFLVWVLTSLVYTIVLSVLFSQYIPIVPKIVSDYQLGGYELNKFGYTFGCFSLFYLSRICGSYLFYNAIGNAKKWRRFYFTTTRFFFVMSLILIILSIANFYFVFDKISVALKFSIFFIFGIAFKQFIYLFHKNRMLPEKWYYKILYICCFQIAPMFALWKVLFF